MSSKLPSPGALLSFTLPALAVYILLTRAHPEVVTMSIFMKRRRSLFRRVIFLTALALVVASWITSNTHKPNNNSNARVASTARPNARANTGDEETPDTPSAGDEVDEGDIVRVDTQLVSVPAVVTDNSGRPLSGLRAENFRLIEDGQVQTITNFGTTETPFEIALLLDTSGSTREDVALDSLGCKQLYPGFASRRSCRRSRFQHGADSCRTGGDRRSFDAVDQRSRLIAQRASKTLAEATARRITTRSSELRTASFAKHRGTTFAAAARLLL